MSRRIILGIDVGLSTTKIVGFDITDGYRRLMEPLFVRATDPVTSMYGALGKFTSENDLSLNDIEKVMVTGVGASEIKDNIYSLKWEAISEFDCIGLGGRYLSEFDRAIIVSLGTGTALVYSEKDKAPVYLGGTGVGGGTLVGLSKKLLGMDTVDHIEKLAMDGDLTNVDIKINALTNQDIAPGFADSMTASNFGNVSDIATNSDVALGIINMVFETVGMVSVFAARNYDLKDIVLTGNLTTVSQAKTIFDSLNRMFNMNFVIPKYARFGTVIGAALAGCPEEGEE